MKKIEVIIKPEKLEDLKSLLEKNGVTGLMVTNIMGYGNQKGYTQIYRGVKYSVNLLPKLKVEMVVHDENCDELVKKIQLAVSTNSIGDGKIFIYNVEDAVRIRTGEHGENAI